MRVLCRDVRGAWEELGRESFDKVVCNPPYFDFADGTDGGKTAGAKREGEATLDDFIRAERNACVSEATSRWLCARTDCATR